MICGTLSSDVVISHQVSTWVLMKPQCEGPRVNRLVISCCSSPPCGRGKAEGSWQWIGVWETLFIFLFLLLNDERTLDKSYHLVRPWFPICNVNSHPLQSTSRPFK